MSQISAAIHSKEATPTRPNASATRQQVELAFTATTLGLLILSYFGESRGWSTESRLAINLGAYIAGGWFGVFDAIRSLQKRRLDINFLMVAAAIGAAFIDQWHEGITLLFLFSLSNTLQSYAIERSRSAISGLMRLRPSEATVVRGDHEVKTPVESLRAGDLVRLRPGELVATDGVIRDGHSELDQSSVTGESVPVDKGPGDAVLAGTLNGTGSMLVEVTRAVTDSTLAKLIRLVESAQAQKARTQQYLDRIEGLYAGVVVTTAAAVALAPWFWGGDLAASFYRAMVLLVVASPCALIIATPAAILSAIANGAMRGVLFKGGVHLERLAQVRVVAFDKTGTLTTGNLVLTDFELSATAPTGFTKSELLATAAALESRSEHPIAKAILKAASDEGAEPPALQDFRILPGRGVHARADGYLVWIGGERMYREHGERIPDEMARRMARLEAQGKTVLLLHREISREGRVGNHEDGGGWLGLIAVADSVRPEAAEAIRRLRKLGIKRVVMLTGDNPAAAHSIAKSVALDEFHAQLLPEEKVKVLKEIEQEYGPVLMVGDGVNDAPALAAAHVGSAMGAAGSDVALETADLVLMADDLAKVPYAIGLSRRAARVVRQNLAFAVGVIVLLIIAAMGFGLALPLGVIAHEGSTLLVVANGLRLLAYRPAV